jgi:spore germination protein KC
VYLNNRNIWLCLLIFVQIPLLSGCWDAQEIDQRATVMAIGIDHATEEEQEQEDDIAHLKHKFPVPNREMIKLTAQIAIPGRIPLGPESTGGAQKSVLVLQVVGHTIEDALVNLQQELADQLFLGHLRIIVLNEEIARHGTKTLNDFLKRNPQIRRTASLVVSKEPASTYMKISPELERIPSLYMADMVDNLSALGKFPPSFIGLFWTHLSSKGQDPYLPYLKLKKGDNIQLNGLAYFNGDKMVGKTSPLEIGIFMSVIGIKKGGYGAFVEVPGTDEVIVYKAISRKTKIEPSIRNGKPHVTIKIRYEGELEERDQSQILLNSSEIIKKIEDEASKDVVKSTRALIRKTQQKNSDIFGFGEHIRAKLPRYWNSRIKTKETWEELYSDLTFDIEVDTHIHRVGMKAK